MSLTLVIQKSWIPTRHTPWLSPSCALKGFQQNSVELGSCVSQSNLRESLYEPSQTI